MKHRSTCCKVRIRNSSIGWLKREGSYLKIAICPSCYRFCHYVKERDSKIFHAALQLLKNIYKGMIITIDICFLLPCFLLVLMITHVVRTDDKITLYPLMRSYMRTHDLSIKERTE